MLGLQMTPIHPKGEYAQLIFLSSSTIPLCLILIERNFTRVFAWVANWQDFWSPLAAVKKVLKSFPTFLR